MPHDLRAVPLSSADAIDDAYRITTLENHQELADLIGTVGLLSPPYLLACGIQEKRFRIVAGFRRIHACRRLGMKQVPAFVLPEPTPEIECIRIAVSDNAGRRELNPIEISRALHLIARVFPSPSQIAETAAASGLKVHRDRVGQMMLLSQYPEVLQQALLSGDLSMASVKRLGCLPHDESTWIGQWMMNLKPSVSLQRELLQSAEDIAGRERCRMIDVFRDATVQSVMAEDIPDRNVRCERVRKAIRRRRYPHLTSYETAYAAAVSELPLGQCISLLPPRDFEGTRYTCRFKFSTTDEFAHAVRRLSRVAAHPALPQILKRDSSI